MKRNIVLAVMMLILLLASNPVLAAPGYQPVKATDVEIIKKVTLNGPASKGRTKPAKTAATGIVDRTFDGNKYAIVIGINDYPGTVNDLQYCVADAQSMSSVLKNEYDFKKIVELYDKAATFESIQDTITSLAVTAGPEDEVVFFFSGHGAKGKADDGDQNKIDQSIVVNTDAGSWGYVWDGQLKEWFSEYTCARIVFIFDSCLSGGMAVLNGTNRIVNMACTATGLSYESSEWGHGQFTYYFVVEGMEYGTADTNQVDSMVTVEEAFDYAKANCVSQTPTIADGFTNDLLP